MIRSLKKLKIWSRRKKKKKISHAHSYTSPPTRPAPPPPIHCCSCSFAQPSAPPLPSWLDFEQSHIANTAFGMFGDSSLGQPISEDHIVHEEIVSEITPLCPSFPISSTPSYQQYMVTSPVYGVPVAPATQTEKFGGVFGCAVSVGANLIRCFCPCFRFRQRRC
ncbi:hypothetical protein IFM89_037804 [Coptis chinensis]|uniref:Uncharacterized protein n=1 Tax=Coptis chinensis TaxID=261450 RepID=A0A835IH53_9MAGN|nr:hypothetical protein IFM89_037804 [Coptis chinensis]